MESQKELVDRIIEAGILKTKRIIDAFYRVDRSDFITEQYKRHAYDNEPLPIGPEQTISQPSTVAFMMELLDPQPGERILDIGSGSGWTTALLAEIVGESGRVYGVEVVPDLVEFGRNNISKYGLSNAEIVQAKEDAVGLPDEPVFDRILVSAASAGMPAELAGQYMKTLVIPIGTSVWKFEKKDGEITKEEHPGYVFVPLK